MRSESITICIFFNVLGEKEFAQRENSAGEQKAPVCKKMGETNVGNKSVNAQISCTFPIECSFLSNENSFSEYCMDDVKLAGEEKEKQSREVRKEGFSSSCKMSIDEVCCDLEESKGAAAVATNPSLNKGWMRFCADQLQNHLRNPFGIIRRKKKIAVEVSETGNDEDNDDGKKDIIDGANANNEGGETKTKKAFFRQCGKTLIKPKAIRSEKDSVMNLRRSPSREMLKTSPSALSYSWRGNRNEEIAKCWPSPRDGHRWQRLMRMTKKGTAGRTQGGVEQRVLHQRQKKCGNERRQNRKDQGTTKNAKTQKKKEEQKKDRITTSTSLSDVGLSKVKSTRYKKAVVALKLSMEKQMEERWQLASKVNEMCQGVDSDVGCRLAMNLEKAHSDFLRAKRLRVCTNDFDVVRVLGKGAFGIVWLVRQKQDGELFALKQMSKNSVQNKNQRIRAFAERDVLAESSLRIERYVVKLYNTFQDDDNLYQVMEFLPGGDLMDHLRRVQYFSEKDARFYIAELVEAVETVHALGFVHRDIKPDNIVLNASGHLTLLDFGLCKVYNPLAFGNSQISHENRNVNSTSSSCYSSLGSPPCPSSSASRISFVPFDSTTIGTSTNRTYFTGGFFQRDDLMKQKGRKGRGQKVEGKEDKGEHHESKEESEEQKKIGDAARMSLVCRRANFSREFIEEEKQLLKSTSSEAGFCKEDEADRKSSSSSVSHPSVLKSNVGTPHYMAPEIYGGEGYTKSVDWWSLGIILFECLYGGVPFNDIVTHNPLIIAYRVLNWPDYLILPHPSRCLSDEAVDLMKSLLCAPEDRLTAEEIKCHRWFRGIPWGSLHTLTPPISVFPSFSSSSVSVKETAQERRDPSTWETAKRRNDDGSPSFRGTEQMKGEKKESFKEDMGEMEKLPSWAPHKVLKKDFNWLNYTFKREQLTKKPTLHNLLRDLQEEEN